VVSNDLQQEFITRLNKSKEEFTKEGHIFHKQKIQVVKDADKALAKVSK